MRDLLLLGLLLAAGCPHPPPPAAMPDAKLDAMTPPAPTSGIPSCPAGVTETPDNVCDGLFTADNHACVACAGGEGCIDHVVEVYCVQGSCALDPACHVVNDPSAAGADAGSGGHRQKNNAVRRRILQRGAAKEKTP